MVKQKWGDLLMIMMENEFFFAQFLLSFKVKYTSFSGCLGDTYFW